MFAAVGDRLIVMSCREGTPARDAEILEVRHADGTPPYLVRWSDNGHKALIYPGPDAHVQHFEHAGTRSSIDRAGHPADDQD